MLAATAEAQDADHRGRNGQHEQEAAEELQLGACLVVGQIGVQLTTSFYRESSPTSGTRTNSVGATYLRDVGDVCGSTSIEVL